MLASGSWIWDIPRDDAMAQAGAAAMSRSGARWQPQPLAGVADGLILFDGVCVFCSRWVRFVIERDAAARFRFTPVQSPYGSALAARLGISLDNPETNALVIGGYAYFKSDASLAVISQLPGWRWARALRLVPRVLRDWFYDRIASNRYRLFGRMDTCLLPTPELAGRFVFDDPMTAG
jgi:predicted DCC family thiol-disulfide oxidoreductase YuxK